MTPAEMLVFIDLCGNKDGYKKEFSPAYYKEYYGIGKDTARKAFDSMKAHGYIQEEIVIDGNEKHTKYYFYPNGESARK